MEMERLPISKITVDSKIQSREYINKEVVAEYEKAFMGKKYIKKLPGLVEGHAYHLYVVEFHNRNQLIGYLRERNIMAQVHYIPVHFMPYYRQFGWKEGDLPIAETYYEGCLSLPVYPSLEKEEQGYVIDSIDSFYCS